MPCVIAAREARLQRICSDVLCRGILSLVVHPDLAGTPAVRAVMTFIEELVARERPRLLGTDGAPLAP